VDRELIDRLIDELAASLASLSAVLSQPVTVVLPAEIVDGEVFQGLLSSLENLLEKGDIAAQVLFDKHAAQFLTMMGNDAGPRLGRAVHAFQFEAALAIVREWRRPASADFPK
jgi:hypothetical protein